MRIQNILAFFFLFPMLAQAGALKCVQALIENGKAVIRRDSEENGFEKLTALATRYHKTKDKQALDELIMRMAPYVDRRARYYAKVARATQSYLDLFNLGLLGVYEAAERFEPAEGKNSFFEFAKYRIQHRISRRGFNFDRVVGMEAAHRALSKSSSNADKKTRYEAFQAFDRMFNGASLDAPLPARKDGGESNSADLYSVVAAPEHESTGERIDRDRIALLAQEFRETLSPREKFVFDSRFYRGEGQDDENFETQPEVGARLGISRTRVQETEQRVRKRFMEFLKKRPKLAQEIREFIR